MGDTAASGSGDHRKTASELPGGISRRLTDAGRKKSQKSVASGTRASSLELAKLVMVVALLVIDSGSRWCSWKYTGAAVEVSKMFVSTSCCTLVSCRQQKIHRDLSHVTRVQAQIEF